MLGFERGVSMLAQHGRLRPRAGRRRRARPADGQLDDPVIRQRLARLEVGLRGDALQGAARAVGRRRRPEASISKLFWANWHQRLGELAMDVAGSAGLTALPGSTYELDRSAAALPVLPRRHDLRRHRRDPAQHPRRARARPAPRGTRMTATRPEQPVPDYVAGHGLLAGKVVVDHRGRRRRASVRGRRRRASRRAPASSSATPTSAGSRRRRRRWPPSSAPIGVRHCPATSPTRPRCSALFDAAVASCGGVDVVVNNAGLGGTATLVDMTDEQWSQGPRRHPQRHVPLHRGPRCASMSRAPGAGVIVNNASVVGWRAQAGPGPLRRGQGRRDGADPLRGDRGRRVRRAGQRRRRRAWPCTRTW